MRCRASLAVPNRPRSSTRPEPASACASASRSVSIAGAMRSVGNTVRHVRSLGGTSAVVTTQTGQPLGVTSGTCHTYASCVAAPGPGAGRASTASAARVSKNVGTTGAGRPVPLSPAQRSGARSRGENTATSVQPALERGLQLIGGGRDHETDRQAPRPSSVWLKCGSGLISAAGSADVSRVGVNVCAEPARRKPGEPKPPASLGRRPVALHGVDRDRAHDDRGNAGGDHEPPLRRWRDREPAHEQPIDDQHDRARDHRDTQPENISDSQWMPRKARLYPTAAATGTRPRPRSTGAADRRPTTRTPCRARPSTAARRDRSAICVLADCHTAQGRERARAAASSGTRGARRSTPPSPRAAPRSATHAATSAATHEHQPRAPASRVWPSG